MKYFQVINLDRQEMGPFKITEKGLQSMQNSIKFKGKISVVGECDESGNLLSGIAEGNFTKPKPTPSVQVPPKKESVKPAKKIDLKDMDMDSSEALPDMFKDDFKKADSVKGPATHDFNNLNNGKENRGTGVPGSNAGETKRKPETGKKAGRKTSKEA